MKPLISTFALVLGATLMAPAAQAETVCMTSGEMKAALIDWYGESPQADPNNRNEQIWASEVTGTWTMIRTYADGRACVLAQGDDWIVGSGDGQVLAQARQ